MKNIYHKGVIVLVYFWILLSSSYMMQPLVESSRMEQKNHTSNISDLELLSKKALLGRNMILRSYDRIIVDPKYHTLSENAEFVEVTVIGVQNIRRQPTDWVAMFSPSTLYVGVCPDSEDMYAQSGDVVSGPLLCRYPVKAQYVSEDPDYLACKKTDCVKRDSKKRGSDQEYKCIVATCNATLKFHVVNFRTDISFNVFLGGFNTPYQLAPSSDVIRFTNPNIPLFGHLSSVDSTGTSMRLTWVSGHNDPQVIEYANNMTQVSSVTTFTPDDMCGIEDFAPAKDFGWHDPGYIHSAVMTGLQPSTSFGYRYGSDSVGWSELIEFTTPPEAGAREVKFLAYGDMGTTPLDKSYEHLMQPGSKSVVNAMKAEINSGAVNSIFHLGGTSRASGFMVKWDYFLHQITPLASRVSYMTAIGNHERDYPDSGSVYSTPDSGGECGVPYETYFRMPVQGRDKPWYSIKQGSVHFIVISTENNWSRDSEQYQWIKDDLDSVDRSLTPWVIFCGHRPMYSSYDDTNNNSGDNLGVVDPTFVSTIEPLLHHYKIDLVLSGHVHNYERTCSVFEGNCLGMPEGDERTRVDRYNLTEYTAPVHVVIGMAGFYLNTFPHRINAEWSLIRKSNFGYLRVHATRSHIILEFVESLTMTVEDKFILFKEERDVNRQ